MFRIIAKPKYFRERVETPDHDFLDLDWLQYKKGNPEHRPLLILSHGLEGSTSSRYIRGMAKFFSRNGYTVMAMNKRGCSGETNRKLQTYHSGHTADIEFCVSLAVSRGYNKIALIGFSLGGNQSLLYASGVRNKVAKEVFAVVALSTPIDLKSCAYQLAKPDAKIYMRKFLTSMRKKIIEKNKLFPEQLDIKNIYKIKTFKDWDDKYTGPIHGFKDANEYWQKCSSLFVLNKIKIPTLLIQSRNDPFLTDSCFPNNFAARSNLITLEDVPHGGHCGFSAKSGLIGPYWSEKRAFDFCQREIP